MKIKLIIISMICILCFAGCSWSGDIDVNNGGNIIGEDFITLNGNEKISEEKYKILDSYCIPEIELSGEILLELSFKETKCVNECCTESDGIEYRITCGLYTNENYTGKMYCDVTINSKEWKEYINRVFSL